jgi:hypothetical protein
MDGGKQMKIYVVTEGEYSDYHICGVFTKEKKAERYAYLIGGDVEEYEDEDANNPEQLMIEYDRRRNEINVKGTYWGGEDRMLYDLFYCYVPFSERMAQEEDKWKLKDILLKIAQDRYAKFMARELGL